MQNMQKQKKKKGYSEAVRDALLFSDLMNTLIDQTEEIVEAGRSREAQIQAAYTRQTAKLTDDKNLAAGLCQSDRQYRNETARRAAAHVKETLSGIRDPHFHRTEKDYRTPGSRETYTCDAADTVHRKLASALKRLDTLAAGLNQAFIPPAVSGVIGLIEESYREDSYRDIMETRDEVLALAETLIKLPDVANRQQKCERVFQDGLRQAQEIRNSELRAVPEEADRRISRLYELFARRIEDIHRETELLSEPDRAITVGHCLFHRENSVLLARSVLSGEKNADIQKTEVRFCLTMNSVSENLFFLYEPGQTMAGTLCSLSADILFACEDMEIILVDRKGLGSSFLPLQPLRAFRALSVIFTDAQIEKALGQLEKRIADTYENSLPGHTRTCLVIDDLVGNLDPKFYDRIVRIMNIGVNAGIYVLCSAEIRIYENNRQIPEFLSAVCAAATTVHVEKNGVRINGCTRLILKTSPDPEHIASVESRLAAREKASAEIPVARSLPTDGHWQKKSSARCLTIDFGIDENGKTASFEISSERPYALIIGDVRVGKSSLLHTMILQLLSNYSPEQVRIAIGDFKNGADFNVYARGNLKSVDAVINDEDPDAMLSFLQYYVRETQIRQCLFEQLENSSGMLVRKYEDFRDLYDQYRSSIPPMPRIVLLIDEFQSLFDGAACASYMTELVRKGATYGIHIILSSQRAVSDNPRNGFTASLKDYFTSRFVFRTPQNAAGSMLAERCADTGTENTGIQRAPLLKKGQAIYNSYMGQKESDNTVVQCYYASPQTIGSFIRNIAAMNGEGHSILLKRNAKSEKQPAGSSVLRLGKSVAYHRDALSGSMDSILDDTDVSVNPARIRNMILSGADERILPSVVSSVITWRKAVKNKDKRTELHIFGGSEILNVKSCRNIQICYHRTIQEQLEELERQKPGGNPGFIVNVFVHPDKYRELTQSGSSFRSSPGAEAMAQVFEQCSADSGFSIAFVRSFKNLRSSLPCLINAAPIHIASVGDQEDLKYAMSDSIRLTGGNFDVPDRAGIKAYYYNKDTENSGKVILYMP